MELFATAARGTEVALRDELREHRFRRVRADRGGVHFEGDLVEAGRACLESRVAVRVLARLAEHDAQGERALYDGVRAIDWRPWLTPRLTLAVSSVSRDSALTHTQFIAQKTKDAIVDSLRDALGARPSVDLQDADVRVFVHLVRDRATVYLDVSGESLHRRGWRARIGGAPLKETLAAALLRMSGWDRARPLCDPMCGSGTLAIEADLWARGVAPGILRDRFGFERWASHEAGAAARMAALRETARARVKDEGPTIEGSDVDGRVVDLARENARAASAHVSFAVAPLSSFRAPSGAFIVTNPPYGERLQPEERLYAEMGEVFGALAGRDVAILAGTPAIERAMPMRAVKSLPVWNGPIECRLLCYTVSGRTPR
ncbi:MAG: RNA methyltransferase [Deltaproteobacteria bacterium]|nr:RNA methyltransferase [Deltaproteobacteria bacterium]